MKKEISHNTTSLTLLGVLEQQQLKVGEGNSGPVSILFDNGSTNKPGIRYVSSSSGSATEYTITDGSTVYVLTQATTPITWPMGTMDAGEDVTLTPALTGAGRIWLTADNQYVMMSSLTDASGVATGDVTNWILASFETPIEASSIMFSDTVANPEDGTWTNGTTSEEYDPSPVEVTGRSGGSGWEYSNDGITWTAMSSGSDSVNLTGEPISITQAYLADGKATISHNLGCKYPLGIRYDKIPQNITFQDDNTMIVDYGDQSSGSDVPTLLTYTSTNSYSGSTFSPNGDTVNGKPVYVNSNNASFGIQYMKDSTNNYAWCMGNISLMASYNGTFGYPFNSSSNALTSCYRADPNIVGEYTFTPSGGTGSSSIADSSSTTGFTAILWFYGSTQAMLAPPPLTEYTTPINMTSNTSDADWEVYVESPNAKIEEGSVNAWKACAGSETTDIMYLALASSDVVTDASAQVDFIFHRKDDQAWVPTNLVQGTKLNYPISNVGVRTITLRGSNDGTNWVTITDVNGNESNTGTVGGGGRVYTEVSLDYSNNTVKYKYWDVCMNKDITYSNYAYAMSIVAVNKLQFTYLM